MIGRVAAGVLTVACLALPAAATGTPLRFAQPRRLPGAAGSSEPQLAVGPDGTRYAITGSNTTDSSAPGALAVFRNTGGGWTSTAVPGGSRVVGPDVAVTVASSGRLVALEEDSAALSLVVSYSDDRGATWRASSGLQELADQDRPWLSAGPDDTVNLLYHNGFSSNATHNMYVESSTDGGATFGAPVPLTLPGSAPFLDLQCADSGGPSALLQNPTTGRLYAVWGSRHGPVGGCGVLPLTPFTLVPDNRVWVATSPTGAAGTWTSHLAVDYSADGNVVGMQLSPAALDTAGNLWLAWTTPPHGFPDDSGAGIAVRRADPTLKHWTAPRQVIANRQPGIVVPQLVAGDPGRIGLLYLRGATKGSTTSWYPTVSTVIGSAVTTTRLSGTPSYVGSATALMGSGCDPSSGPVGTVENNPVTCARSADVIGAARDRSCAMVVVWPSLARSHAPLGASTDATWVSTQTAGPSLCVHPVSVIGPRPLAPDRPVSRGLGRGLASTGPGPYGVVALVAIASAALLRRRSRSGSSCSGDTAGRPAGPRSTRRWPLPSRRR